MVKHIPLIMTLQRSFQSIRVSVFCTMMIMIVTVVIRYFLNNSQHVIIAIIRVYVFFFQRIDSSTVRPTDSFVECVQNDHNYCAIQVIYFEKKVMALTGIELQTFSIINMCVCRQSHCSFRYIHIILLY